MKDDDDLCQDTDELSKSEDEVDYPPNNYVYRCVDVFFILTGVFTFYVDWGFDILTAYNHWWHGDTTWFALTMLFICVPSIVMTTVSFYWYVKDVDRSEIPNASMSRWVVRVILLIFQHGPVLRYADSLYYGILSRRYWQKGDKKQQQHYYLQMLYEDGDCILLRLFESFMEAAPQLILQLYILTLVRKSEYGSNWFYVLCFGCLTSLISLAWGVTSYARGSRFPSMDKNNISLLGSIVLLLWHVFSIGARVTAMVLFASQFRLWLFVVCFAHWLLMVIWLMARRSLSNVCSSKLGEITLSFVLGAVYIFSFINEQEEPTKNKYIAFYIITGIENTIMVVLWLIYANPSLWYYIPGVVFHFVSFLLGLVFMSIYYGILHPSLSPVSLRRNKPPLPSDGEGSIPPLEAESQMKSDLIEKSNSHFSETVI